MLTETRTCTTCKTDLALSSENFYRNNSNPRFKGFQYVCKPCKAKNQKSYYTNLNAVDKEVFNAKRRAERAKRYETDPDYKRKTKNHSLKWLYGITIDEYDAMLEAQDFKCAICRTDNWNVNGKNSPVVDHCHETGVVRGLLCGFCNLMIGYALDKPEVLSAGIEYLTRELENMAPLPIGELDDE